MKIKSFDYKFRPYSILIEDEWEHQSLIELLNIACEMNPMYWDALSLLNMILDQHPELDKNVRCKQRRK